VRERLAGGREEGRPRAVLHRLTEKRVAIDGGVLLEK
jgi:hypothetical protein